MSLTDLRNRVEGIDRLDPRDAVRTAAVAVTSLLPGLAAVSFFVLGQYLPEQRARRALRPSHLEVLAAVARLDASGQGLASRPGQALLLIELPGRDADGVIRDWADLADRHLVARLPSATDLRREAPQTVLTVQLTDHGREFLRFVEPPDAA